MIYSGYEFYEKLEEYFSKNPEKLKEILSLESQKQFNAVKNVFGFAPMLVIKRFLLDKQTI